ncbi:MAG: hypothetical protein ABEJ91_00075 [Candidatus Nanohaloarchaea archaeon]
MRVEITVTEGAERLAENLEKRTDEIVSRDPLVVEIEDPELLSRVPGVESFRVDGEQRKGLGGAPVKEQAYARIESRRDAAKAFLATVMGYDLRVLDTSREWDYRNLKRYNPDIKHLKFDEPREELAIDRALFDAPELEEVEIELEDEDVEEVYRKMLA